jgi:hypothetical protein
MYLIALARPAPKMQSKSAHVHQDPFLILQHALAMLDFMVTGKAAFVSVWCFACWHPYLFAHDKLIVLKMCSV